MSAKYHQRHRYECGFIAQMSDHETQRTTYLYSIIVNCELVERDTHYCSQRLARQAMVDEVAELNYIYGRRLA